MSLKQELAIWAAALAAHDAKDYERTVKLFVQIAVSSRILVNIGLVHATTGKHELAAQAFSTAIEMDAHHAIAYFQRGVSRFLLTRYDAASRDFENALLHMRSNLTIDYEQIGLKFKLYSCEVLFNRGLSLIYAGKQSRGLRDFEDATRQKQVREHDIIDKALDTGGAGLTVFSISAGVLYRPSELKLKNLETRDYLGQAKLVAASESHDAFTGFTGVERAKSLARARSQREAPLTRSRTVAGGGAGAATATATTTTTPLRRNMTTIATSKAGLLTPPSSGPEEVAEEGAEVISGPVVDVLSSYYRPDTGSQMPSGQSAERVAAWARDSQASEYLDAPQLSRSLSASTGSSGYLSRRPTHKHSPQRSLPQVPLDRAYDTGAQRGRSLDSLEEITTSIDSWSEITKIIVKLHTKNDLRGMTISTEVALVDFVERVRVKLGSLSDPSLKFKDGEGNMISLVDEGDWEAARDEAKENTRGRGQGKLDVYVLDA